RSIGKFAYLSMKRATSWTALSSSSHTCSAPRATQVRKACCRSVLKSSMWQTSVSTGQVVIGIRSSAAQKRFTLRCARSLLSKSAIKGPESASMLRTQLLLDVLAYALLGRAIPVAAAFAAEQILAQLVRSLGLLGLGEVGSQAFLDDLALALAGDHG